MSVPEEEKRMMSPAYGNAIGQTSPLCPLCNHQIRKDTEQRTPHFATYCPLPWNAGWNGTCDACGHRFEKVLVKGRLNAYVRKVSFRPGAVPYRTFIDEASVFRGVEIVIEEERFAEDRSERRITLTMDEVSALCAALKEKDALSVCHMQYSWKEDWT